MSIAVIKPHEFVELCQNGKKVDLIDVRTPVEFREVHVENARNVSLDRLDPVASMQARDGAADEPMYFICRSGSRGRQACEKFVKAGFPNVVNVEGGTMACVDAGLPVVRGKKAVSLERQVRIVAGCSSCWGRSSAGSFTRRSSGCRRSSEPVCCSRGSPTPAGWAWSWPECRGTGVAKIRRPVPPADSYPPEA